MYLIARVTLLIVYAATQTGAFYAVGFLMLIALAASVSIIQPYRGDLAVQSNVDIVLILMIVAWYGSIFSTLITVSMVILILPHVYLSYIILQWLFSKDVPNLETE